MQAYIDGEFVSDARIPLRDLGLLRGYGVFEYVRTYNGAAFHLKEHLKRLEFSAAQIALQLPKTLDEIAEIGTQLLSKECTLRILVTGGVSPDGMTPVKSALYALSQPYVEPIIPPIKLITTKLQRLFPQAKTLNYIPALIALNSARAEGASEALFMNERGELLEATASNVFFFKNGKLITSNSPHILRGITRAVIIKLFEVEERPIFYEELNEVSEAFTSSSIKELVSISHIDHFCFQVGPRTAKLKQLFKAYTASNEWQELPEESYLPSALISSV